MARSFCIALLGLSLCSCRKGAATGAVSGKVKAQKIANLARKKDWASAWRIYYALKGQEKLSTDQALRAGLMSGGKNYWFFVGMSLRLATTQDFLLVLEKGEPEVVEACLMFCPTGPGAWQKGIRIVMQRIEKGHWNDQLTRSVWFHLDSPFRQWTFEGRDVLFDLLLHSLEESRDFRLSEIAVYKASLVFDIEGVLGKRIDDAVLLALEPKEGMMELPEFRTGLLAHRDELLRRPPPTIGSPTTATSGPADAPPPGFGPPGAGLEELLSKPKTPTAEGGEQ